MRYRDPLLPILMLGLLSLIFTATVTTIAWWFLWQMSKPPHTSNPGDRPDRLSEPTQRPSLSSDSVKATVAITMDLRAKNLGNATAFIPPQCYTATEGRNGAIYNPCYTCHIESSVPNFTNDQALQTQYAFPEYALINRWLNLFRDRRPYIAHTTDEAIIDYIRQDNYQLTDGRIILRERLRKPPKGWDFDGDGQWRGYLPDCHFAFDSEGFDRARDGSYTGWRAFAYTPFPSTYWPTNGATDDVLIRLAEPLRQDSHGVFDLTIYKINLAIVEAMIKRKSIPIDPIDEQSLGVDLNKNNVLDKTDTVVYDWEPLQSRFMSYVGLARGRLEQGRLHIAAGLFPEGTEFLSTLRYIDIDDDGMIRLSARLKELRYARKRYWLTYNQLRNAAADENADAVQAPDDLGNVFGNVETGVSNGEGWQYQGFIESSDGELRPQTYAEMVYCVACHSTVGAVTDGVYSFARKLEPPSWRDGWYHWQQKSLYGTPEPIRADGHPVYTFYLRNNHAGDEYRANTEIMARFFDTDGQLRPAAIGRLHRDITYLIWPSRQRAMALNNAYKQIVEEQSFVYGRDPLIEPATNVHCGVGPDQPTGVTEILQGPNRRP